MSYFLFYVATTSSSTAASKCHTLKHCPISVSRFKARYNTLLQTAKTDFPKHHVTQYIRLALVEKEYVTVKDQTLNEFIKLTMQGEIDKILKKKEPLHDLQDIFHYQNKPCPRLILIMGGPGEY